MLTLEKIIFISKPTQSASNRFDIEVHATLGVSQIDFKVAQVIQFNLFTLVAECGLTGYRQLQEGIASDERGPDQGIRCTRNEKVEWARVVSTVVMSGG